MHQTPLNPIRVAVIGVGAVPPHRGARRQEGQRREHQQLEGEVALWHVTESMTLAAGDASPSHRLDHVCVARHWSVRALRLEPRAEALPTGATRTRGSIATMR
jgi:hypothetical protein